MARVTAKRAVSEWPRGFDIRVGGGEVGSANAACRSGMGRSGGYVWHWYASSKEHGIDWKNSAIADDPFATAEEARDACLAYVKACLAASGLART
jgi:hypothetical protein